MITIIFWNVGKSEDPTKISRHISLMIQHHDVDMLILAEADKIDFPNNNNYSELLSPAPQKGLKLKLFYKKSCNANILQSYGRSLIIDFCKPPLDNILLVTTHVPSKKFAKLKQGEFARALALTIKYHEETKGHERTIVIGDLNLDPFEEEMRQSDSFNAVMDRKIAYNKKISDEKCFYNPMWNYFGDLDARQEASGTYYYRGDDNLYWHLFDQILLRPDLAFCIQKEDIKIITKIGTQNLLKDVTPHGGKRPYQIPDTNAGSDHLPILVNLKIS